MKTKTVFSRLNSSLLSCSNPACWTFTYVVVSQVIQSPNNTALHLHLHLHATFFSLFALCICFPSPIHKTLEHFMIHQFASFHLLQSQGTFHLLHQGSPMELSLLSFLLQFQEFQDQRLMLSVLSMHDPERLKKKDD